MNLYDSILLFGLVLGKRPPAVCSPDLPTCVDVCHEEKWIKKRDACVLKARKFREMCYVHSCNVTVTLDDFKDVAVEFFADMVGVQLAEEEEDDEEGSTIDCARDCDAHLQYTLRKCPCYQTDEEKVEEKNIFRTMKDSILNLTMALEEITEQYAELKMNLTSAYEKIQEVESKAHRCVRAPNYYRSYEDYYDC
ncbi:Oidioi.mRNA.OKI2018_I69.PAR.g13181.t1.cds [Oikopleura dioica]|uniref:Oidioi.mRNA.OKI2018_I69.PAR.g13181.t1.cds n=1 Tax=Oikopleura dioica TaxID=34765 RepID=A0ABN7S3H1_OIKDI|nr:Oidioi.mRNA.OKI2018_I69.PAR.g13181.t1.cds [Oikopleura dioica]